MSEEEKKYTGVVIWFNNKGIGFIKPDDGGPDKFVHYSNIISDERFKTLTAGQVVEYTIGANKNGPQAENVIVIAEPDIEPME